MRIATLGHAGLYVETEDQRLLVDPVFAETLVDGMLEYCPMRRLDLDRMPTPTALVVTHAHFDHFHRPSLERLPRDIPVVLPDDAKLIGDVREIGFSDLRICAPWTDLVLGTTRLLPTPSGHEEPEMGVVISDASGTFWHMADGEVTPVDGARVLRERGSIDVVSAKYQPVVRASMGYLRSRGARFEADEVVEWLEAACAVDPALVFPYASGLAFRGRHAWFNRYAFPLSAEETADLLCRRLGPNRACAMNPGDVIEVARGVRPSRHAQSLPFVAMVPGTEPVAWEPIDTSTLAGLDDESDRARLEARLDEVLTGPMARWLEDELARGSFWQELCDQEIVVQLVVELGGAARLERHLDFRTTPTTVGRGRHSRATSFAHFSGRGLYDVLEGRLPGIAFWLAGEARSYDKTILVEGGRLVAPKLPAPQDENGDPLTYYLRYYHPPRGERIGIAHVPPVASRSTAQDVTELDVLTRRGENDAVVEKKALFALLAAEDAARRSLPITNADLEATSDALRIGLGLHSVEETGRWLEEVGLTNEGYTAVIRRLAAIRIIEKHRREDVLAILDGHLRLARRPGATLPARR